MDRLAALSAAEALIDARKSQIAEMKGILKKYGRRGTRFQRKSEARLRHQIATVTAQTKTAEKEVAKMRQVEEAARLCNNSQGVIFTEWWYSGLKRVPPRFAPYKPKSE